MDYNDLTQGRDKWHTLMDMVMTLILFSNEAWFYFSGYKNSQINMY